MEYEMGEDMGADGSDEIDGKWYFEVSSRIWSMTWEMVWALMKAMRLTVEWYFEVSNRIWSMTGERIS